MLNVIMHDGSRHFCDLPETVSWYEVRNHIDKLPGAQLTDFITDDVVEAWIDFSYNGHQFSINNQFGDYWFFVKDPACPDHLLQQVLTHFQQLLNRS